MLIYGHVVVVGMAIGFCGETETVMREVSELPLIQTRSLQLHHRTFWEAKSQFEGRNALSTLGYPLFLGKLEREGPPKGLELWNKGPEQSEAVKLL